MIKTRLKVYSLALGIFFLDLISKTIIINNGNILYNKTIIPNFFYLTLAKNTGGAFSMFSNYTWILILIGLIFLIYVDRTLIKAELSKLSFLSLGFLVGGVLGNLIDRIIRGEVIDFFKFILFGWHAPIFNIADIFITIGVIFLIIEIIRGGLNGDNSRS